ncbi:hypothetical protein Fmac_032611 [Flemingia macrophylla]|uniref:glucan endo-1,3-beta-D-glucosidase n=1 Tax=Flemingia macrophylla TaxID=520843 RepID=A0ABD1L5D9_9FABA
MEDDLLMHDDVADTTSRTLPPQPPIPSPTRRNPLLPLPLTDLLTPMTRNTRANTAIESSQIYKHLIATITRTRKNFLVPAMKNVNTSLSKQNPNAAIKVSSPLALFALQSSFPASSSSFKSELVEPVIKPMLEFLRQTDSHLILNAYPFFAYAANADKISLNYALLRDNPDIVDSDNDLKYSNLFNAQIDAIFAAMSTLEYDNVLVMVSDARWPPHETLTRSEQSPRVQRELGEVCFEWEWDPFKPNTSLNVFLIAT